MNDGSRVPSSIHRCGIPIAAHTEPDDLAIENEGNAFSVRQSRVVACWVEAMSGL
jgi:hypothetical protein